MKVALKPFDPSNRWLTVWRYFIVAGVLYSIFIVPYEIGFVPHFSTAMEALTNFIHVAFIVDMAIIAHTAYWRSGQLITDRRQIRMRYIKGTFWIDFLANFPFELLLFFLPDHIGNIPTVGLLSLPHILRIHRLFQFLGNWETNPNINQVTVRVIKLVFVVAISAHLVAVAWHMIWLLEGKPMEGWGTNAVLSNAPALEAYIHSLYWAVTVLTTVGFGDITPTTEIEILFTIVVMFIGVTIYAYIIANITMLIPRIQGGRIEHQEDLDALRDFMRERRFPAELQNRVINYKDFVWSQTQGDYQRRLLSVLPHGLRHEVAAHLAEHILGLRQLFPDADEESLTRLVMAAQPEIHPPGGAIAASGQIIQEVFFITDGEARIISGDGTTLCVLAAGEHFGSINAKAGTTRSASVIAYGYCSVLRLDRTQIKDLSEGDPKLRAAVRRVTKRGERVNTQWKV